VSNYILLTSPWPGGKVYFTIHQRLQRVNTRWATSANMVMPLILTMKVNYPTPGKIKNRSFVPCIRMLWRWDGLIIGQATAQNYWTQSTGPNTETCFFALSTGYDQYSSIALFFVDFNEFEPYSWRVKISCREICLFFRSGGESFMIKTTDATYFN
jgi:hypothetical protein